MHIHKYKYVIESHIKKHINGKTNCWCILTLLAAEQISVSGRQAFVFHSKNATFDTLCKNMTSISRSIYLIKQHRNTTVHINIFFSNCFLSKQHQQDFWSYHLSQVHSSPLVKRVFCIKTREGPSILICIHVQRVHDIQISALYSLAMATSASCARSHPSLSRSPWLYLEALCMSQAINYQNFFQLKLGTPQLCMKQTPRAHSNRMKEECALSFTLISQGKLFSQTEAVRGFSLTP